MTAPTIDLGTLPGGMRLRGHKTAATASTIVDVPIPAQLVIPLEQHVGEPAQALVVPGDHVQRGQLIATTEGALGAPVHASSSGIVVAIEPWPVSRRHGDPAPCIVIECDGRDEAVPAPARFDIESAMPDALLQHIIDGGIVGLGGAVFPTAQKIMQARGNRIDMLILNGVECEPYISCDDMLMQSRADAVVGGATILMLATGVERCVIAIESDKPAAIAAVDRAIAEAGDDRIVLKQVPTIYPSGGEDQLVLIVASREVPSGGLPTDAGCLVQNVGTAAAVYDWIVRGEPLITRITTVTGDGVAAPVNVRARIGTPVADIISLAGGYTDDATHLVIGGPLTGKSVSTDRVPLVKASNCILVTSAVVEAGPELPCIRCGYCAEVCPVQLLPQQLYWYAGADDESRLREHGLTDCIECGCCDLVCPSHIPLTADFRAAKGRIRELEDEKARAERARRRFEARSERLERERLEREAELARQKDSAKRAGPEAIAAILRRKRHDDGDH